MAEATPLFETYNRIPLRFERGEGVWLVTESGERYLDFAAGIAVNSLGHSHPHLVETMKARLSADLTEPMSLTSLAEAVDLSPFHAARLFSRETGLAPHAWRNQLRLARALPALRAGVSATDVALAQDFSDLSHFTRYFRRAFGVSPGKWSAGRGV